jgi:hypothetical protein
MTVMERTILKALASALFLLPASQAFGQQTYVGRYDVFAGFSFLDSPHINLWERGFQTQAGYRARSWLTFGFDYSVVTGHTSLTPDLLTDSVRQQLAGFFAQLAAAGRLPPGYALTVPIDSTTQNFAAGPQISWHRWRPVTLFIRPSIGAIYEKAVPHATDAITTVVIAQLAPSGRKTDWTGFYGFGGGFDLNITEHLAVRIQADFVHDHLFSDLLKDGRNTVRVGIGPAFQFGHNVMK